MFTAVSLLPLQGKSGLPGIAGQKGSEGSLGKDGQPGLDGFPGPQVKHIEETKKNAAVG